MSCEDVMRDFGPGLPPVIVMAVLIVAIGALVFWIMSGSAGGAAEF